MTEPIAVPEKLSDLIRLAIADGRKLYQERAGEYYPNATIFHSDVVGDYYYQNEGVDACHICLAGGVMAGTLNSDIMATLMPVDFNFAWTKALRALDYVRMGQYVNALTEFYGPGQYDDSDAWILTAPVSPRFEGWDQFLDHLDGLGFVVGFFQDNGY